MVNSTNSRLVCRKQVHVEAGEGEQGKGQQDIKQSNGNKIHLPELEPQNSARAKKD
jgi:hypothetical protein